MKTPRRLRHFVEKRFSVFSHTGTLWLDIQALYQLSSSLCIYQVFEHIYPYPSPNSNIHIDHMSNYA